MAENILPPDDDEALAPLVKRRRWRPRLIWIVPIIAALVGLSLVVRAWREAGPQITITFQSAEGIDVGKTLVKARNVTIGRVSRVALSDDQATVIVTADLDESGARVAKKDSVFWVVRSRIGVGGASGLDTLLTGAYVGVQTGTSTDKATRFIGLENPPPLAHAKEGQLIELRAASGGSIAIGSPVYFRQFRVGQVIDLHLLPDGNTRISLFVDAPDDRFLTSRTRFWNASGIEIKASTDGLKIKTESLASVLGGGIAFDDGPESPHSQTWFVLYKDEIQAKAPPTGEAHFLRMQFTHPVRGLAVDAPVEFMGVNIGSIVAMDLGFHASDRSFPVIVTAKIFPQLMGSAYQAITREGNTESEDRLADFVGHLVERGLRAQARPSSLLSGSLYVALDFFQKSDKVHFDPKLRPLDMPTIPASSSEIEKHIVSITEKLDALPLQSIGQNLNTDLADVHSTLNQLQSQVFPSATKTLESLHGSLATVDSMLAEQSPFRDRVDTTLDEAQRTLESIRDLAEFIDRHPVALIKGRRQQPTPRADRDAERKP